MATADKLITVAENVPKVYHSGQLNIVKNAECLKGTKSDTAMLLDDVSPVIHEMGVRVRGKNLFSLANRTWANFGASANTTVRNINKDNFYFKISANNYASNSTTDYEIIDSNSIKITTTNAYGLGVPFHLIAGQQYTISCIKSDNTKCRINVGYYDIEGNYLSIKYNVSTFTMPENAFWTMLCFVGFINSGTAEELTFSDIQLELGTTSTAYTPYVPDLTAVKVSRCGKNLFNQYAESKFIYPYRGIAVSDFCNNVNSARYTLSVSLKQGATFQEGINFGLIRMDKSNGSSARWFQTNTDTNFRLTYTSMNSLDHLLNFYVALVGIYPSTEDNWNRIINNYNIQIEYGKPPTDYEPYQECADYTPTADGTVNGVTSLYPNTTLTTDTEGVLIDCEYYKDVDKTFNELTTSVALSGGDS